MMDTLHEPVSARKAAVLLASLDPATADALLRQMPPAQAEQLRAALIALGDIDPSEQEMVVGDFFAQEPELRAVADLGVELDESLSRQFAASSEISTSGEELDIDEAATRACRAGAAFGFLDELCGADLALLLAPEHPQTIALVMSHLSAERAANAIAQLPAHVQAEVMRRLVDFDNPQPELVAQIERGLQQRLCAAVNRVERRAAGVNLVQSILAAADRQANQEIRRNVARHDRPLAQRLGQSSLMFADLVLLDDASLWKVFSAADPDWVVLAVAGARPELAERIIKLLPPQEAVEFDQALSQLGPTRLSDVEEAQCRIAQIASRLEFEGVLQVPQWRLGTVAA